MRNIYTEQFESLFKQHYTSLCRYAYVFTRDQKLAEDTVQEVFTYLWGKQQVLDIQFVHAYLFKAVKNRSINAIKGYYATHKEQITEELKNSIGHDEVSDIIHKKELQFFIMKAVDSLPPKCRMIFFMKQFEDLTYNEIAAFLKISTKTVENQLKIAYRKISKFLAKY